MTTYARNMSRLKKKVYVLNSVIVELMNTAVSCYNASPRSFLQDISEELDLNPIKVR